MPEFVAFWRRRLALHGALIFLFAILIGLPFFLVQQAGLPPETIGLWRIAHAQGLTHGFLLFGMAIAFSYFRLNRRIMQFCGWSIVLGSWAATVGGVVSALFGVAGREFDPDGWNRIAFVLFLGGAAGVGLAIIPIALRALWDLIAGTILPHTWINWARTVETRPRAFREPGDVQALIADVDDGIRMRMPIRAFGSRGSWNPGATTHGMMIDTYRLTQATFNPNDTVNGVNMPTVWVEAGRKIGDLSDFLARQSPAHTLESATVVPWVRVGGAVSNGCHGTGIHHVEFPELIVRMQLVQDVGGTAVLTSYERPDPMTSPQAERDRWRALLVNLGTLGVIYSVTFECVPMFNVRYRDSHDSMEQVFDTLLPSIINTQYSEIFWFPYSKKCRIKTWESTNDPLEGMPAGHWFWQWLQIRFLGPPIYHLASLFPWFTKIALWLFDLIVPEIERVVQLPEAMHYQRHFSKVVVMGYGIPIDLTAPDPYARFRQAWFAVVDRIDALENQGLYPQNLVLHTRFIGDAAGQSGKPFIAPSTGNQQTAYIEILTHRGTPGFEEYFETIEGEWLSLGGRPHWGKITFHRDEIRDAYPRPNMEAFLRVREELDPNRVFLNDYLRELLRVGS